MKKNETEKEREKNETVDCVLNCVVAVNCFVAIQVIYNNSLLVENGNRKYVIQINIAHC